MKADYMRNIHECCHGDNGIFYKDPRMRHSYASYLDERKGDEICATYIQADLREDNVKCELSDVDFYSNQKQAKKMRQIITKNLEDRDDMCFLDFL